jgi:hypothetical protein
MTVKSSENENKGNLNKCYGNGAKAVKSGHGSTAVVENREKVHEKWPR